MFDLTSAHEIGMGGRSSSGFDPLVLSYSVLFACLILTGLLVTFFGEPLDNGAAISLDLASTRIASYHR